MATNYTCSHWSPVVISGALRALMMVCAAQSHIVEKSELARLALSLRSWRADGPLRLTLTHWPPYNLNRSGHALAGHKSHLRGLGFGEHYVTGNVGRFAPDL